MNVKKTHVAEDILPGHPDRLADAVAESIVDRAVLVGHDSLVGVEVAVHRRSVFVTGRIAVPLLMIMQLEKEELIDSCCAETGQAYERAGYTGRWALDLDLQHDIDGGGLLEGESEIRGVSDDQNVVVGHASWGEATNWLPAAVYVARRMKARLSQVRAAHADALGPDGKVLVVLDESNDGRLEWRACNIAIQHAEGVDCETLHRLLLGPLEDEARALETGGLPGLGSSWVSESVRINGAGDFTCGGPHGDNGLSGKKLAVDYYGPGVPLGGGAICGKDPHKVDRVGPLRARQIALRLARASGARSVTTWLGWMPGQAAPGFLHADVDGEAWPEERIRRTVRVPDLDIEATFRDLELGGVRWADALRSGYFGSGLPWERG